ncbi:hypothetical protein [Legionella micdadei]|uniref:hypothetical protein n=1 Tax=Legionella micdadei TaxID=451 RepID=UPI0009EF7800|nr:hypothetical protein [Legionella micdadei]ARH00733.1 hypothetical protein B6V88_10065 [Legionella micdadei]
MENKFCNGIMVRRLIHGKAKMHIRKIKLDEEWLQRNVSAKLYKKLKNSPVKSCPDLLVGEEIELPISVKKIEGTNCYKVGTVTKATALIGRKEGCKFGVPLSLSEEEGEDYWLVTDEDKVGEFEATHGALFRSQEQAEEFAKMYSSLHDFCKSNYSKETNIHLVLSEATYCQFERELKQYHHEIKKSKGKRKQESNDEQKTLDAEHLPSKPILATYEFFTVNDIKGRYPMPDNSPIRVIAFSPIITHEFLIRHFPASLWVHNELIRLGQKGEIVPVLEVPQQLIRVSQPVASSGFFGKIKEVVGLKPKEGKHQVSSELSRGQNQVATIQYLVENGLYNNNPVSKKAEKISLEVGENRSETTPLL